MTAGPSRSTVAATPTAQVPMTIDSHQHFWVYSPEQYPWMTDDKRSLRRNYLPDDLAPELASAKIAHCIAVQARQSVEESRWLLELAERDSMIHGVVGWVDLRSPELETQLERYAAHPKFLGVRHVVQDEPDDGFLVRPEFVAGIKTLARHGLAYDLLIFPRQLPAAIRLVEKFPEQRFVLDHIAKPDIAHRQMSPWREDIRLLAAHANVWCKISGMITEANWTGWRPDDFKPYLDVVFEAFGPGRVMYGSDWPVCLLAGTYGEVRGLVDGYVSQMDQVAQAGFWGQNAFKFYARTSPALFVGPATVKLPPNRG